MQIGQVIEIKIDDINSEGAGVGSYKGFKIFVDGALPSEIVKAKILTVKKNYAKAIAEKIIDSSLSRTSPRCEYFYRCGACHLQHIDYQTQLKIKTDIVKKAIRKFSGLDSGLVKPTISSLYQWGYRNKMQYPLKKTSQNKILLGYYKKNTHEVVDIINCPVLPQKLNEVAQAIRKALQVLNFSIYDEDSSKGLLRHLLGRYAFATDQVAITFVVNDKIFHNSNRLIDKFFSYLDSSIRIKNVSYNVNLRKTNVILGNFTKTILGSDYIIENLGSFEFAISPTSFFQINPFQAKNVFNKVLDFLSDYNNGVFYDLYCGVGTISLWISDLAQKVFGIEEIESAISDAKENTKINKKNNVIFRVGKVEKEIKKLIEKTQKVDAIIIDPPRNGCSPTVVANILKCSPKRIIYVSCDPATLARDIKLFSNSYTLEEIQPFDMFPQTIHVECVAKLNKKD